MDDGIVILVRELTPPLPRPSRPGGRAARPVGGGESIRVHAPLLIRKRVIII